MLDETIIKLLEPTIEKIVAEKVAVELREQNERLELTLAEACELVGKGKNTLKDTFYQNRKEVEKFVYFGEGRNWRILKAPFIKWWTNEFQKTF